MAIITPENIRRIILQQSKRAQVGHIGSALSISDIVAALYANVLRIPTPDDPDRDRFVLSKGHAAIAVYAALYLRGWIDEDKLNSFCQNNSHLGTHPEHIVPGIDFTTGSLGLGLSFGAGAALAARAKGSERRAYVLLSDAECNEGAVWEAVMFAAHHGLSNLTAIVDVNGQQAFGYTCDVLDLSPLEDRWRAFGWDAVVVDGHSVKELTDSTLQTGLHSPRVILAQTTFGQGVSFMKGKIEWHYKSMDDDRYAAALAEIEDGE